MNTFEESGDLAQVEENGLVFNFAAKHPEELARVLSSYDSSVAVELLQLLPDEFLAPIFAHLSQEIAATAFATFEVNQLVQLVDSASMDDASRIAYRLPASRRSDVLALLSDSRKKRVLNQFIRLGENTVGAIADKDFLWFPSSMRVEQVRNIIQSATDRDAVESALILDDDETVLGLLDYISLSQADGHDLVGNCIARTTLVPAEARPHAVVHFDDWHRVSRLPIVDQAFMPIGVLRWSRLAELAESQTDDEEFESFSIVYEILNTMIELGRSVLSLPSRR